MDYVAVVVVGPNTDFLPTSTGQRVRMVGLSDTCRTSDR
jgi:hypothetical protein